LTSRDNRKLSAEEVEQLREALVAAARDSTALAA
jgi:hypothetical protein